MGFNLVKRIISAVVVRLVLCANGAHVIEVRGLETGPVGSAGEVIGSFRDLMGEQDAVDEQRTLTFGDCLALFERVSGAKVEGGLESWDETFTTSVGTVKSVFREVKQVDADSTIDRAEAVLMEELIEMFSRVIGCEIVLIDNGKDDDSGAIELLATTAAAAKEERRKLTYDAIKDLKKMAELAESPDAGSAPISPLWTLDDRYDTDRPMADELLQRPWEGNSLYEELFVDYEEDL